MIKIMQTFLPYVSFYSCSEVLDKPRRNKQIVECYQILKANHESNSWSNHPAVLMWKGYDLALCTYTLFMHRKFLSESKTYHKSWYNLIDEYNKFHNRDLLNDIFKLSRKNYPDWLGDKRFHASHRSNLLRKDFEYYSKFNWEEGIDLPYFWPTKEGYKIGSY